MSVISNKPAENATAAVGITITVAQGIAKTFFHTSLTPDVLTYVPAVVAFTPHAVTALTDAYRARVARKESDRIAAAAAAQLAFKQSVVEVIGGLAQAGHIDPAIATAVAEHLHVPADTSSTVGVIAP
jgi:5-enolpyruvylshikimate-3-phosphate synthase